MNRRELLTAAVAAPLASLALPEVGAGGGSGGTPFALVTADRESHVVVLNLPLGSVEKRIRTLPAPRSIESNGPYAVVAHTTHGRLTLIDPITLSVHRVVTGLREPRYTAVDPGGAVALVTDSHARELVAVDLVGGRVVGRAAVPGPARHVTSSPASPVAWIALGGKAERIAVVEVVDPTRPRLVRTFAPPAPAHDVVFAPDGKHVWVTSGAGRSLWVYEADGRRPLAELPADAAPQHVAFVDGRAFVASGDSGTLRVHRPDGALVHEAAIPLGSYNVTWGWRRAVTPSLGRGTVALADARGRVRAVRRVARAAHDACVVVGP
jgi:DNA-binding beta-propeller fold protein YncE